MIFEYEVKSLGMGEEGIYFVCESRGIFCRRGSILGIRMNLMGKKGKDF